MNRVYIILVNWNGWLDTIECLESVFRSTYSDFRVIVCDNCSSDASLERIKEWAGGLLSASVPFGSPMGQFSSPPCDKPLEYIEYQRSEAEAGGVFSADPALVLINAGANLGFAGGNNVGIRYALARGDFSHVWLLNNDTVIEPGSLNALVQRMLAKPESGMCGSALFYYDNPDKVQALGGGWHCKWVGLPLHYGRFIGRYESGDATRAEAWMNYVEGASMLVSNKFLHEVGLMCEDYFLYFEETDWALRAKGRFTLAYAPESIVYHKVGGSIGTSSNPRHKSEICDYYNIRNRLLFTSRFYVVAIPSIILVVFVEIVIRLVLLMPSRSWMLLVILWNFILSPARFKETFYKGIHV